MDPQNPAGDGTTVPEDVKAKSGGAKVLVGSSIRLGAGMMLRDRRGARCAWAQIDEPFGALDEENRPISVPGLIPESEAEKRRYAAGVKRREERLGECVRTVKG